MVNEWDNNAQKFLTKGKPTLAGALLEREYMRRMRRHEITRILRHLHLKPRIRYEVLKTDLWNEAITGVTGNLLTFCNSPRYSLSGMDISPLICNLARERCGTTVNIRHGSITNIPFKSEHFDLIMELSTIDHLATDAEKEKAVQEYKRVLKVGGTLALLFDYPAPPALSRIYNRLRYDNYPLERRFVREILAKNGFYITESFNDWPMCQELVIADKFSRPFEAQDV